MISNKSGKSCNVSPPRLDEAIDHHVVLPGSCSQDQHLRDGALPVFFQRAQEIRLADGNARVVDLRDLWWQDVDTPECSPNRSGGLAGLLTCPKAWPRGSW